MKLLPVLMLLMMLTACAVTEDTLSSDRVEVFAADEESLSVDRVIVVAETEDENHPPSATHPSASRYPSTEGNSTPFAKEGGDEPPPEPTPQFAYNMPEGFVYLRDIDPEIAVDLKYAGEDNFTGAAVDGYLAPSACIMTKEAAEALSLVRQDLLETGFGLIVYDAYRPQKAVTCFAEWAKNDDESTKDDFYPNEDKSKLFGHGYISTKSAHSRGSTLDVSLIDLETGAESDMGGHFDLLDPGSSHGSDSVSAEQAKNRKILKNAMAKRGFRAYNKEWWHYTLQNEPFAEAFDFDVE